MDRKARRKLILHLIQEQPVATQEQLLSLLKEQGVSATQATISRDIHALNIVKTTADGQTRYTQLHNEGQSQNEELYAAIHDNVEEASTVQFINVLKTTPDSSYATVLAGLFDDAKLPQVAGTVAGNDTLIIICHSPAAAEAVGRLVNEHRRNF
ncbi:MAG TPA: arginine repressor [Candidatus Limosilactobacillus merdipullorum]|uniref:Arginine repressor n=1 Tax=Candidatus Limosilactobacillus merdipullorum TaxID=2838653 RepID=A0A9D1QQF1_9LACO|nr:arginine repressor [Candidatus Limosilactobacillus merdipullorum]